MPKKNVEITKRISALLLALVMLIGTLPLNVFAEELSKDKVADPVVIDSNTINEKEPTTGTNKHIIRFNPNGGSGEMKDVEVADGENYTLPKNELKAPEGKKFKSWTFEEDEQKEGYILTVTRNLELKANWEDVKANPIQKVFNALSGTKEPEKTAKLNTNLDAKTQSAPMAKEAFSVMGTGDPNAETKKFTITFDPNGGTGEMAPVVVEAEQGERYAEFKLPKNEFTPPEGKEFAYWSGNGAFSAIKDPEGSVIAVKKDTLIKPVWRKAYTREYMDELWAEVTKQPNSVPQKENDSFALIGQGLSLAKEDEVLNQELSFEAKRGYEYIYMSVRKSVNYPGYSKIWKNIYLLPDGKLTIYYKRGNNYESKTGTKDEIADIYHNLISKNRQQEIFIKLEDENGKSSLYKTNLVYEQSVGASTPSAGFSNIEIHVENVKPRVYAMVFKDTEMSKNPFGGINIEGEHSLPLAISAIDCSKEEPSQSFPLSPGTYWYYYDTELRDFKTGKPYKLKGDDIVLMTYDYGVLSEGTKETAASYIGVPSSTQSGGYGNLPLFGNLKYNEFEALRDYDQKETSNYVMDKFSGLKNITAYNLDENYVFNKDGVLGDKASTEDLGEIAYEGKNRPAKKTSFNSIIDGDAFLREIKSIDFKDKFNDTASYDNLLSEVGKIEKQITGRKIRLSLAFTDLDTPTNEPIDNPIVKVNLSVQEVISEAERFKEEVVGKVTFKDVNVPVEKLKEAITNLPQDIKNVVIKTPADVSKKGDTTAVVTVTFKDGSTKDITIPIEVLEPITTKETVPFGGTYDITDNITGIPEDAVVKDVTKPGTIDNMKPGNYTGKVEITLKDGTKTVVDVPVEVLEPTPVNAQVKAIAEYIGKGGVKETPENGKFKFVLKDEKGTIIAEATDGDNGDALFKELSFKFKDIGEHNYIIEQVKGDDPTISYDDHVEKVTIKVSVGEDNKLKAEVVYDKDGPVFTNKLNTTAIQFVRLKDKEDPFVAEEVKNEKGVVVSHKISDKDKPKTLDGAEYDIYQINSDGTETKVSHIKTENGISNLVENLVPGKYKLVETKAPEGYFAASKDLEFEIKPEDAGKALVKFVSSKDNNSGVGGEIMSMPSTGGQGTKAIMFGGGALLVIMAGLFVLANKKKEELNK